eukprot:scaffold7341_cov229-Pinguiococcus_pyrenoidosus.AAC.6
MRRHLDVWLQNIIFRVGTKALALAVLHLRLRLIYQREAQLSQRHLALSSSHFSGAGWIHPDERLERLQPQLPPLVHLAAKLLDHRLEERRHRPRELQEGIQCDEATGLRVQEAKAALELVSVEAQLQLGTEQPRHESVGQNPGVGSAEEMEDGARVFAVILQSQAQEVVDAFQAALDRGRRIDKVSHRKVVDPPILHRTELFQQRLHLRPAQCARALLGISQKWPRPLHMDLDGAAVAQLHLLTHWFTLSQRRQRHRRLTEQSILFILPLRGGAQRLYNLCILNQAVSCQVKGLRGGVQVRAGAGKVKLRQNGDEVAGAHHTFGAALAIAKQFKQLGFRRHDIRRSTVGGDVIQYRDFQHFGLEETEQALVGHDAEGVRLVEAVRPDATCDFSERVSEAQKLVVYVGVGVPSFARAFRKVFHLDDGHFQLVVEQRGFAREAHAAVGFDASHPIPHGLFDACALLRVVPQEHAVQLDDGNGEAHLQVHVAKYGAAAQTVQGFVAQDQHRSIGFQHASQRNLSSCENVKVGAALGKVELDRQALGGQEAEEEVVQRNLVGRREVEGRLQPRHDRRGNGLEVVEINDAEGA